MSRTPMRRIFGALAAIALVLPLAAGVAAAPAHAETLGQAVVAKADSYIGDNYTIGPWQENWCGDFVRYIWTQEGVSQASWMTAHVPDWTASPGYHTIGSGYTPQPGDAVVYADNTYSDGSHIAIVTDYSNGLLSDVGGDEGGTKNGPFWATSSVQVDEGNGRAFDPSKTLFPGSGYDMWVIGYVSLPGGTPPVPPSVSAPSGIANGGSYHGTVTVTGTASQSASAFYVHLQQNGVDKFVSEPAIPGGTSFSYQLDTTAVPNGTYQALTGAVINGTAYYSTPITITIGNSQAASGTIGHAATLAANGTIVTFQVRADGNLYESNQTGPASGFTAWSSLSTAGGLVGMPSAVLSQGGGGTVSVFARTTDGHIAVFGQSGPQSGFSNGAWIGTNNPTTFAGDPTVTLAANGTMAVFAIDNNGDLWETNQSAVGQGFGAWGKLSTAGGLAGTPTAVLSQGGGGTVSVFARTTDGHIAVFGQSGPQSGFSNGAWIGTNSPTAFAGDPTVTLAANGTMAVFASDGAKSTGTQYGINQSSIGSGFGNWWVTAAG